jgi:3-deoxy-D-manno-octulosonic-acid transferase
VLPSFAGLQVQPSPALPRGWRAYNIAIASVAQGIDSPRPIAEKGRREAGAAIIRMYFLYSILTVVVTLILAPYFLVQSLRGKNYLRNLPERLGLKFPPRLAATGDSAPGAIWIHSVSVGETLAAVPLARALKERYPERRLVISTTTATGQALARERMQFADAVFYFPLDLRGPVRRALAAVRPCLVVIFETEIWPNFLREARRDGVPVVFVNGRISQRSFRRFSKALWMSAGMLRGFLRRVLSDARLYLMQDAADAQRLLSLGAPADRVAVIGNLKYDWTPPAGSPLVTWLEGEMARSHKGPLLVAGSVIAGEEPAVLEGFGAVARIWPRALLVLAPRKPERFAAAAALVQESGLRLVKRSSLPFNGASSNAASASGDVSGKAFDDSVRGHLACAPGERSVLLLDSIGELASVYQLADAVFVGGSLEPAGGHNPLEPATFGKVPVFGASMENFREIAATLIDAGAAVEVRSGKELGAAWTSLLGDDERRSSMGQAAREIVTRNRGATAAALERLAPLLTAPREPQ